MFLCVYYLRRVIAMPWHAMFGVTHDRDRDSQTMSACFLLAGAVLLTPHSPNSRRAISGSP